MPRDRRCLAAAAMIGSVTIGLAGCDFFEAAVEETKATVKKTEQVVKKEVAKLPVKPEGSEKTIELKVGTKSVIANGCHVKFIPPVAGRPAVLKITSYPNPDAESFPSIWIQATATDASVNEILGKPLQATIKVTANKQDAVWFTPPDSVAYITIRNIDDTGRVLGAITSGAVLNNTATSVQLPVEGSFDGMLQ